MTRPDVEERRGGGEGGFLRSTDGAEEKGDAKLVLLLGLEVAVRRSMTPSWVLQVNRDEGGSCWRDGGENLDPPPFLLSQMLPMGTDSPWADSTNKLIGKQSTVK